MRMDGGKDLDAFVRVPIRVCPRSSASHSLLGRGADGKFTIIRAKP